MWITYRNINLTFKITAKCVKGSMMLCECHRYGLCELILCNIKA